MQSRNSGNAILWTCLAVACLTMYGARMLPTGPGTISAATGLALFIPSASLTSAQAAVSLAAYLRRRRRHADPDPEIDDETGFYRPRWGRTMRRLAWLGAMLWAINARLQPQDWAWVFGMMGAYDILVSFGPPRTREAINRMLR